MPAMLAMASPFIGRETAKPVWVSVTDKFQPEVELGDAKVVEYFERTKPHVIPLGPSQ